MTALATGRATGEESVALPHYLGYTRVSTTEQADSGLGLAAQEAAIRAEAARRGVSVEIVSDAGFSGKHVNPALADALDRLRARAADGLIVAKVDRLARSVRHAADILAAASKQGWNLVVLDLAVELSTPQGRAMAQMLSVFAELERELIGARTREALAVKIARGEPVGRRSAIPAGVLRRIVAARATGASFPRIAAELMADEVPSPTGLGRWEPSTVRRAHASFERAMGRVASRATLSGQVSGQVSGEVAA